MTISFDYKDTPVTGHVEITKSNGTRVIASKTKGSFGTDAEVWVLLIAVYSADGSLSRQRIHVFDNHHTQKYRDVNVVKIEYKAGFKVCANLMLALEVPDATGGEVRFV